MSRADVTEKNHEIRECTQYSEVRGTQYLDLVQALARKSDNFMKSIVITAEKPKSLIDGSRLGMC